MSSRTITDFAELAPTMRVNIMSFGSQLMEAGFNIMGLKPRLVEMPERIYNAMREDAGSQYRFEEMVQRTAYLTIAAPQGTFGAFIIDSRDQEFGNIITILDLHDTGIAPTDIATDGARTDPEILPDAVNIADCVLEALTTLRTKLVERNLNTSAIG